MLILTPPPANHHSLFEDVQGIVIGALLVALSIQFLRAADLFTGQIAGLSLLIGYDTGWPFGVTFFVLNLPFYALALRQMGWRFTLKSLLAVSVMSVLAETLPMVLTIEDIAPALGAPLFGVLAGVGMLSLFRHGATLGGLGVVALWLQDRRGIAAGNTQLAFDLCLFAGALMVFDVQVVAWSLVGSVVLNIILTVNHRRDRYVALS